MGLPSYIINYNDSAKYIQEAIRDARLSLSISDVNMDKVTEAILNTSVVEGKLSSIVDINDVINQTISNLSSDIENISNFIITTSEENKEIINQIETKLKSQLDVTKSIKDTVSGIADKLSPQGEQRIKGFYEYVPPIREDFILEFIQNRDIELTAISMSQIGWKYEDTYDLMVGEDIIFSNISTKEVAQKKKFNKGLKVPANTSIKFILHNNSGNSRQMWLDIEYLIKPQ
ncbi:hypothetical protein PBI_PBS1_245 [Bacillus phage PBS1]|uniref:Uncharacterized protein n=1 Tax=Bacillus phage PBS1 TaxID=2884423 RepID=A0A223LCX0_BPPB1|nr:hypothetical protein FK780_gp202 [Bacillus phage PBS1]ASU00067.1 hypothetical protein PBI_PBS1_245 [Bacillus phage PBS1]BDE75423.1 hypothetical protein [Bacillus phage PBS1]